MMVVFQGLDMYSSRVTYHVHSASQFLRAGQMEFRVPFLPLLQGKREGEGRWTVSAQDISHVER